VGDAADAVAEDGDAAELLGVAAGGLPERGFAGEGFAFFEREPR